MKNRYDFIYFFDVKDGNPNGDPDAGGFPRLDQQTGHGLVTDVCLKRKIRNYVGIAKNDAPPHEIYVKEHSVLDHLHARAHLEVNHSAAQPADNSAAASKRSKRPGIEAARDWLCKNFYDIRAFGAVMASKEANCGQVRGPVQLGFARSVDPVMPADHAIARMAVTSARESDAQGGLNQTFGRKYTIPYALYRAHGFISPHFAGKTGFNDDDLRLLWDAFAGMFDHDRSSSRGLMTARRLIIFRHDTALGNAPASALFEAVPNPQKREGVKIASDFSDYEPITINTSKVPREVTVLERI